MNTSTRVAVITGASQGSAPDWFRVTGNWATRSSPTRGPSASDDPMVLTVAGDISSPVSASA